MASASRRGGSLFRWWWAARALRVPRREADRVLSESRFPTPRLAWRSAELTAPDYRIELARALTEVVRSGARRGWFRGRSRNSEVVRGCRVGLLALVSRLHDLEQPVLPRGVLLVEQLLHDRGSPLLCSDVERLTGAIAEARTALEEPIAR